MERINWIWRTLQTLSVVVCIGVVPTLSNAFTGDDAEYLWGQLGDGQCYINKEVTLGGRTAEVALSNTTEFRWFMSGGSKWSGGGKMTGAPISAAAIADCLGTEASNITQLEQTGANAFSFSEQTYMGFSFTLTTAAGGLPAGPHEYFIGTQPSTNAAATDFAASEDAIRSVITDDATRSLTSTLNANENMVRKALERLRVA